MGFVKKDTALCIVSMVVYMYYTVVYQCVCVLLGDPIFSDVMMM